MIINNITFPKFTGIKCNMMPFIQGDSKSLPKEYQTYANIIDENFLEKGEIGFLTIDESYVEGGKSQRGFNSAGIERNVHIEVGRVNNISINCWGSTGGVNAWGSIEPINKWGSGSNSWGGRNFVTLDDSTRVLIANSISNTCRYWDVKEMCDTDDGDLSHVIHKYPIETGLVMQKGQLAEISIFTPHECIVQEKSGNRQFFRIVGKGVHGREDYFTINPLIDIIH